jgi:hypothetical protein
MPSRTCASLCRDRPDAIDRKLGVHVAKMEIDHKDTVSGLIEFIQGHRPDLLVLATHGREGSRAGPMRPSPKRQRDMPTCPLC